MDLKKWVIGRDMDLQKECEAFEDVFPCSTGTVLNEYGHYESQVNQHDAIIQNISWVVWQAAKAQANKQFENFIDQAIEDSACADERRSLQYLLDEFRDIVMVEVAQDKNNE